MGPGGVGPGDATRLSSTPSTRTPAKTGRAIRCDSQTQLDTGPHGIPRSCQLSSQSCNGGSFEAQLSDLPADRPHTQTRPRGAHRVVLLNESHDPAGGFAAYPAPFMPPDPCRDPGPGRVDHLHHHAPVALCDSAHNQGTPSWLHDSTSSTRAPGVRATLIRWKPSKPTSRSHRSHRSSDTQQQVEPDTARGP